MQSLTANKQTVYYALFTSETDNIVGNLKTGEKVKTYGTPVAISANVSAARGSAETDPFGITDNYDRTIVTTDLTLPIAEDTILWVGITPDNSTPHNYKVVRIAKSLNSIVYAIKKVSVK